MLFICHFCYKEAVASSSGAVESVDIPPSKTCQHCGGYLHSCANCKFYDDKVENQCLESNAERVLLKGEANSCECFLFNAFSLIEYLKNKRKDSKRK